MNLWAKVMLGLAGICLVLGCWSLIQWELHEAGLGFGISALLLFGVQWERKRLHRFPGTDGPGPEQ